jgi:hypothetical protein
MRSMSASGRCCRKSRPMSVQLREMDNNSIGNRGYLNQYSRYRLVFETLFFAPAPKIVFRQHRSFATELGCPRYVRSSSNRRHQSRRRPPTFCARSRLMHCSKISALFDDLVGECEKRFRNLNADCLGGRDVDDKLKFGRLLDRDIAGLRAAQNLVHDLGSAPEL